ncbi:YebY family protein [Mycobacterium kansasii]|uniref:YebY family protein n=1 Tax=Mycobacterium kansasii TaxID=1768 RepID=UPI0021560D2C|nr:YebY family protein [Mycobacterium kansasii]
MPPGFISQATWTDGEWPLTVPEGTLACESLGERMGRVTFTAPDGTTYAVNGLAKGTDRWAEIDAIWASYPEDPLAKVNIGPLIDRGLSLC